MSVERDFNGVIKMVDGKDFIRTDRGITWGFKLVDNPSLATSLYIVVKNADGTWKIDYNVDDSVDLHIGNFSSVKEYFKTLIAKIQAWLTKTFPAGGGVVPPVKADRYDELDALIMSSLRIVVNADGTLTASAV